MTNICIIIINRVGVRNGEACCGAVLNGCNVALFCLRFGRWAFRSINPSGPIISLGSNEPQTENSTRNILWTLRAAGA
jgi:hypothetical protein